MPRTHSLCDSRFGSTPLLPPYMDDCVLLYESSRIIRCEDSPGFLVPAPLVRLGLPKSSRRYHLYTYHTTVSCLRKKSEESLRPIPEEFAFLLLSPCISFGLGEGRTFSLTIAKQSDSVSPEALLPCYAIGKMEGSGTSSLALPI